MKFVAFAVMALLLFVFGCTGSKLDQALGECEQIGYEYTAELCKAKVLSTTLEAGKCNGLKTIDSENLVDTCKIRIAARKGPEACESTTCPDGCYISLAIAKRDATICERIKDEGNRDYCYGAMITWMDGMDCDKVPAKKVATASGCVGAGSGVGSWTTNKTLQDFCVIMNPKNLEECNQYDGTEKTTCIWKLGSRTGNCELITVESNVTRIMRDSCYMQAALRGDVAMCRLISEDIGIISKGACYAYIGSTTGNAEICSMSGDYKRLCQIDAIVPKGDVSACNGFEGDPKHECIARTLVNATVTEVDVGE